MAQHSNACIYIARAVCVLRGSYSFPVNGYLAFTEIGHLYMQFHSLIKTLSFNFLGAFLSLPPFKLYAWIVWLSGIDSFPS